MKKKIIKMACFFSMFIKNLIRMKVFNRKVFIQRSQDLILHNLISQLSKPKAEIYMYCNIILFKNNPFQINQLL